MRYPVSLLIQECYMNYPHKLFLSTLNFSQPLSSSIPTPNPQVINIWIVLLNYTSTDCLTQSLKYSLNYFHLPSLDLENCTIKNGWVIWISFEIFVWAKAVVYKKMLSESETCFANMCVNWDLFKVSGRARSLRVIWPNPL